MNVNTKNSRYSIRVPMVALLAASTLLSAACGMKTNPKADYPELQDAVPPHTQQPKPASVLDSAVMQIDSKTQRLYFVQGQTAQYTFEPRVLIDGVSFELVATNLEELPGQKSFTKVTTPGEADKYVLSWAAPAGTLAVNERERFFQLQVELKVVSASTLEAGEAMKKLEKRRNLDLRLIPTEEMPLLDTPQVASATIKENETTAFSVVIKDPGAFKDNPPMIYIGNERGTRKDSEIMKGAGFVTLDDVEELGGGQYRVKGVFDVSRLKSLPGTANEVTARFILTARSPSGLWSPDIAVDIKIVRNSSTTPAEATAVSGGSK